MRIGALYQHCFETRPWATLIVTNGTLTVVADALAQTFDREQEKKKAEKQLIKSEPQPVSWDWHRSARFLAFGSGVAPALAEWNKFLEHNFHIRSATGRMLWGGLARRVLTDQLLFAPLSLAVFVGSMGYMEGRRTWSAIEEKYKDVYWPALRANWSVWPMLQMFNFGVLPLRLRVPFSATCGVAWTLYLSLLNQKDT
ncbi:uncharacterized protein MJAP1_003518 [Malassezia japonica]|uniref:Uncharacterized protein n=1 Tax=Malassezia japonica TaxID=223818 RepID=A0AAF0F4R5_9BASI|nr:uncharacterized protein MJAP1_003518 [Malassezia japonica]WFD40532.1 hypothetical protein MJAP1_003518 [Malassezia japonica]